MIKKKPLMGIIIGVFCVALVLALSFFVFGNSFGKALNPKNYNVVQIKATIKNTYATKKTETTTSTTSGSEFNTDIGETTSGQDEAEEKEVAVMQKNGNIIYESGLSGKYYFYQRDKKNYVLYFDNMYGINEKGKWVEAPAESFNLHALFDFSSLSKISKNHFKKENGYYVPVADKMNNMFYNLFSINPTNKTKYMVSNLKIKISNNRLESITAVYVYNGSFETEQTLTFTYNNTKITIPAVDEVFKANTD